MVISLAVTLLKVQPSQQPSKLWLTMRLSRQAVGMLD